MKKQLTRITTLALVCVFMLLSDDGTSGSLITCAFLSPTIRSANHFLKINNRAVSQPERPS